MWIVEQIIRRAPEFGVCWDLGASVYNHFILRDPTELAQLDLILTRGEMSTSRLRHLFEYSIGLAKEEITRSKKYPLPSYQS
jgi:hypothetical protein